jgi:ankyrin repeat protein
LVRVNMRERRWLGICLIALWPAAGGAAGADDVPLAEVVRQGNRAAVRTLLAQREDVNAREVDGTTALHWAVRADDAEMVGLLIRAGATVQVANRYGITPLWLAAVNGNAAMIDVLLEAGADVNAALPSGETPLLVAARTGKADAVRTLIARGADVHRKEGEFGQTALMLAAAENHPDVCALLIEAGADLKARTTVFELQYSLSNVYRVPEMVKGGFTALLYAARQGSIAAAEVLIAAGADLNEREPAEGVAPLLLAILNGHYDFAAMLIGRGAEVNLTDQAGRSPLYQAVDMRRLEFVSGRPEPAWTDTLDSLAMMKLLLAKGADPNVQLKRQQPARKAASPSDAWLVEGTTPFLKAAKNNDVTVMRILLAHGADPHLQSPRIKASALMLAAGVGWRELSSIAPEKEGLEAVTMLWELGGFDINAETNIGQTALHGAASRGATSIIQFLVEHGARLDAVDKKGTTPLDEAGAVEDTHPARPEAQALLRRLMAAAAAEKR